MNTGWDRYDVERWLNKYPLPADMIFRGEKVWPRYKLKKGFGFWLRTAGPYHPALRGLFNLIVEIIQAVPVGKSMPTPQQLADKITAHEAAQGVLNFSPEDLAPPLAKNPATTDRPPCALDGLAGPGNGAGSGVDFARKLREQRTAEAAANPTPDDERPF